MRPPWTVRACSATRSGLRNPPPLPFLSTLHRTMPKRVFLIRHGETAWATIGRHTGRTDIPLTENGEAEARRLGERLRTKKFDHVFVSPLQRARRTCELAGFAAVATVDPDLAEWHYGHYEGKLLSEIHAEHPGWDVFQSGAPGGESREEISERADRVIARVKALDGDVALFAHGHLLRVVTTRWIGLPFEAGRRLGLGTTSLSIIGFSPFFPDIPSIQLWNAREDDLRLLLG